MALPKLDSEADVSTIKLLGPQTSRKEIFYYEVYELLRLLGSPPREPELVAEVVSSLEVSQEQERSKTPQAMMEHSPGDIWTPRSRTPRRGRRGASVERSLTKVREAHQKALAMAATLEEKWLSCPLIRSQLKAWAHSKSRDCHRWKSRGWKKRHCQVHPEDCHAPYFEYHPSQRSSESEGEVAATKDLNLEEPPELGLEVTCFLQGQPRFQGRRRWRCPPPNLNRRVTEVDDLEGLSIQNTQQVARANHGTWGGQLWKAGTWGTDLFLTPEEGKWTMLGEEWPHLHCCVFAGRIFCCHQILLSPARISRKFSMRRWWHMPGPFSSGQRRLTFTGGKPYLLDGSVIELQEEMEWYLSFSDEDVFKGIALLEETPVISPKEVTPQSTQPTPAGTPVKEATMDTTVELAAEKRPQNRFPGWVKVLHPSRPIVTAGLIPPLSRGPRQRPHSWSSGKGLVWIPQTEEPGVMTTHLDPLTYQRVGDCLMSNAAAQLYQGNLCLQSDCPSEGISNPDALGMAVLTGPTIATMSASHIVKGQGDGSNLHGYRDHLSGESDPQWPQTGRPWPRGLQYRTSQTWCKE